MATKKSARDAKVLRGLLRELRLAAGLRQSDLAERLGVMQSFVSKYESGERRLDALELRRVCQSLNTTLAAFAAKLESTLGGTK